MSLSRSRSTARMRTTTSLVDEAPRASLLGLDNTATVSHESVRRGYATSIGVRAGVEPQVVDIWVDRGYQPAQSVATADAPLRLVFHRRDADHCTERVVFSSPHIERRLAANGTTVVDLPAQPPGVVRFTCGMGRYRGEIALVERRATLVPPRWLLRSRRRLLGGLGAGAAAVALLAGLGALQVETAAGIGVLIATATAVLLTAPRLIVSRPFNQS
jgi:Cupredoxin-like domain